MIEAITGVELAKLVGISDRQVRTLAGKGMPRNPDGTYPAASAVAWYVNWKITGGAPPDLLSARTRREAALAAKAELELAKMCGELMTVAEYTRVISDTFSRVAAKLNALPNRAAGHMIGLRTHEEALRRLQAEVDEVGGSSTRRRTWRRRRRREVVALAATASCPAAYRVPATAG